MGSWIKLLRATALLCAGVFWPGFPAAAATDTTSGTAARRPNIILLLADDMDYADVARYGGKLTATPHIDSIAKRGMEFTNAYVTCPVCGPSRVGILTGQYQDRIGFVTNHGPKIPPNFGLPTTVTLVSESLKDAGYATGMVGKWHLGFDAGMVPNDQGFDYFFGHLHGWHDYRPGVEEPGPILRNREQVKTSKYLTRELADEAVNFINAHREQPYFLYVPFNAVHGPLQASKETLKRFAAIKNQRARTMAAMVYELDEAVGRVLEAVKASGQDENTLVIFTNDNGGVGGQKPSANGKLRGGKAMVYEGGIRVPMFWQWPARIPAGSRYQKVVSTLDFAPTFIAAAGTTSSVAYDGLDLLPFITGRREGNPHHELFWNFVDAPNQKAVRKGDWKAVQPADDASWELYNLAQDVGETRDLAKEKPEKIRELERDWQNWNQSNVEPLWIDVRILQKRAAMKARK